MNKIIKIVLAFALVFNVFPAINVKAVGAISIDDCDELQLIGNDPAYPLDGDYILGDNISCTGESLAPIGDIGHRSEMSAFFWRFDT